MKLLYLAALCGAALAVAVPSDLSSRQTPCDIRQRVSWSSATAAEKQAYIDAVLCLHHTPTKLNVWTHRRRSDDFSYVHAQLFDQIHSTPNFLPWHRYFLDIYEKALQTECGYPGTILYWDWVADSAAPMNASVFDPVLGFGGNGVGDGLDNNLRKPVLDGPFAGLPMTYWEAEVYPHALSRDWRLDTNMHAGGYTPEEMDVTYQKQVYHEFAQSLEGGPHGAVHGGMRGDMGTQRASPNDPLFFLHHAQVDRVWWIWQQSIGWRWHEYSGNNTDGTPVSLSDTLPMMGLAPDGVVGDYIYTLGGKLCYAY